MLSQYGVDPWDVSCLYQERVFGNWMGHLQFNERNRNVERLYILAILLALQSFCSEFLWMVR